jgi:hypothetical protein
MSIGNRSVLQDLGIRLVGLLLLLFCAALMLQLSRMVHVAPGHEATASELGMAAIGFMSFSMGSALTALGARIFDEVEVSQRWARLPSVQE